MEIGRWFGRKNIDSKIEDLRTRQHLRHELDCEQLDQAWREFGGESKDGVFDLLSKATLAEISVPAYRNPNNQQVKKMLSALIDFDKPKGRIDAYTSLKDIVPIEQKRSGTVLLIAVILGTWEMPSGNIFFQEFDAQDTEIFLPGRR